ncbi:MAG: endonuclease MutS2, partial [Deltaproteobacteria bacterium]|nr:endonuclease MutS2 [Deltaproteobacteria bacterium]
IADLSTQLTKIAVENSSLSSEELVDVYSTLVAASRVKRYFSEERGRALDVWAEAEKLCPLPEVTAAMEQVFDDRGQILDTASPQLHRIRKDMQRLKERIQNKLQQVFDSKFVRTAAPDRIITIRSNRYTIALKTDSKHLVPGIIHDYSNSRATCFVEPLVVVELNNQLHLLTEDEQNEIQRILFQLTDLVRAHRHELTVTQNTLALIDLTTAAAAMSRDMNGVAPEIEKDWSRGFCVKQAFHPLLLAKSLRNPGSIQPVPIDLNLSEGTRVLVVSGANTGGKTAALKTLGLAALMLKYGFHIAAAEGTRFPVFQRVMADIGDDQDIQNDLSTFSGHMTRLKQVLDLAEQGDLVLVDEIGTGTDPLEGAALAMAIMDEMITRGVTTVVTTHYNLLKTYGAVTPGVLNAAVQFDHSTNRPTYQLIYGLPGVSNALEVSRKLGFPQVVLDKAGTYLSNEGKQAVDLITKLEEALQEAEAERGRLAELEQAAKFDRDLAAKVRTEIELQREAVRLQAKTETRLLIKKFEEEISQLTSQLRRQGDVKPGRVISEFHQKKRELITNLEQKPPQPQYRSLSSVKPGQRVMVPALDKVGVVQQVSPDAQKVEVLVGMIRINALVTELAAAPQTAEGAEPLSPVTVSYQHEFLSPLGTINIIGLRVEEALPIVDKSIDHAVLSGQTSIEIVHGKGTGRLKEAVREFLAGNRFVKGFGNGPSASGGSGVTLVELIQ